MTTCLLWWLPPIQAHTTLFMNSSNNQTQAYGLTILKAGHKDVRQLKNQHTASIHGNKFWNSSFMVMQYLEDHPIKRGKRVLEIGCGWGLLGIYCNKTYNCQVTAIDADEEVLPFLELHAQINDAKITAIPTRFEKITGKQLTEFDRMYGADICFWDELTPVLFNLIRRALKSGVKEVIIADPGRSPFYELHEKCAAAFDKVELLDGDIKGQVKARGHLLVIKA